MTYAVDLTTQARKDLRRLDSVMRDRVEAALRSLAREPRPQGLKALQGFGVKGVLRIRVGDWRIIYSVDDGRRAVLVTDIKHRGAAYR